MPKANKKRFVESLNEYGLIYQPGQVVEILNLQRKVTGVGTIKKIGKSRIYVTRDLDIGFDAGVVKPFTTTYKPMYLQPFRGVTLEEARPDGRESKEQKVVSKPAKKATPKAKAIGVAKASTTSGKSSTKKPSPKKTTEKG